MAGNVAEETIQAVQMTMTTLKQRIQGEGDSRQRLVMVFELIGLRGYLLQLLRQRGVKV